MPCGETYFTHNILIPLLFTSPNGHTSMANRDTYRYTLKRGNQIVYVGITNQQNRFFHLPSKPMLRVRLLVGLVLGLSALTGQGVPPRLQNSPSPSPTRRSTRLRPSNNCAGRSQGGSRNPPRPFSRTFR